MPLFGGSKKPQLDGLSKAEEARRDALNPEVLRRSGEGGVAGQGPAALAVLREKAAAEPNEALWALLLGWQYMSMKRYTPAIEALSWAMERDPNEVRGYYAAGNAYLRAGDAKQDLGPAATDDVVPAGLTADNLYQEALRCFRKGMDVTNDKTERDTFKSAAAAVEGVVARKAGRL